jgi:hypothetical protein
MGRQTLEMVHGVPSPTQLIKKGLPPPEAAPHRWAPPKPDKSKVAGDDGCRLVRAAGSLHEFVEFSGDEGGLPPPNRGVVTASSSKTD